jgi:serine O-acetyltransferase
MTNSSGAFSVDLAKYFRIDCEAETPTLGQRLGLWWGGFGLHCVAIYRFAKWSRRLSRRSRLIGILPRAVAYVLVLVADGLHHVHIEDAEIGPGFYIGHVGTIYIGGCRIGSNFSVTHNVTIGVGHSPGKAGVPSIGDHVWIGTGSVVYGAITIGNNVTIMPGSILSRDVPDNCLVGGNPARVVMQNYDHGRLVGRGAGGPLET